MQCFHHKFEYHPRVIGVDTHYLPAAGWIGFDPTNNTLADERYIKVAVGRDYEDVAPVRGSYSGTGHCQMSVEVVVERI